MKRFYDEVGLTEVHSSQMEDGWQVTLDGRGLKTVKGSAQIVPSKALAQALADEWESQSEELDPATFPFRDMADYAIDVVTHAREEAANKLLQYADTDTLCYRADPDEPLYARQQEVWEPILTAFEQREGVKLTRISGILHRPQSPEVMEKLRARLMELDAFAMAGLEAATSLAASLVSGLSACEAKADPLAIWQAASLEEEWQADQWGRDTEAEERRAKREADFLRACEFARLSRG